MSAAIRSHSANRPQLRVLRSVLGSEARPRGRPAHRSAVRQARAGTAPREAASMTRAEEIAEISLLREKWLVYRDMIANEVTEDSPEKTAILERLAAMIAKAERYM